MRSRICSILIISIVSFALAGAQALKLEYKYAKGTAYSYRDAMDGKTSQEVMGQEIKSEMNGMQVIRFEPQSVGADGSIVMTATVDSASMHVKAPNIDTTQVQNELIGRSFTFTLEKTGDASRFTAINPSDSALMGSIENQLEKYPRLSDAKVGVGSTWNKNQVDTIVQAQFGGRLITDTKETYTVAAIEMKNGYKCYKLTATGTIGLTGSGSTQGIDLKFEGTGKTTSTHYFAAAQGILVSSESIVDLDMTIGAVGQQQMVIPMTQSMKMTRVLLSK